jgi:molecular chaperone GrpE (heat shock protein)
VRRITQIRRSLSDIFNVRNEMVRAVDDRNEAALERAMQEMLNCISDIKQQVSRGHAEEQEETERAA